MCDKSCLSLYTYDKIFDYAIKCFELDKLVRFRTCIFRLTLKLGDLTIHKDTSPNIISPQVKSYFKFTYCICINNSN